MELLKGLEMSLRLYIVGLAGALALAGAASGASAQSATASRTRVPAITLSEATNAQRNAPAAPTSQRRGLRWNENGRWGLNFNSSQPVGREAEWGDVEAGAYYRLNPRLSVGAAAGLGTAAQDPARAPETDRRSQPRIRLESIFKF